MSGCAGRNVQQRYVCVIDKLSVIMLYALTPDYYRFHFHYHRYCRYHHHHIYDKYYYAYDFFQY